MHPAAVDSRAVPTTFVDQVKDALEHLYDLPHLQEHPLASRPDEPAGTAAGLRLRRTLARAIDELCAPGDDLAHAPQARLANVLRLHYLEGLTVQETALELDLSLRQAFRDLRRAEENLAALLWPRYASPASPPQPPAALTLDDEVDRMASHPRPLDVCALLRSSLEAVARLAEQKGVAIAACLPDQPVTVRADPALARQVLVNTLSHAVQQAEVPPGVAEISLTLDTGQARPALIVRGGCAAGEGAGPAASAIGEQLAARRMVLCHAGGRRRALPGAQPASPGTTLLVVDDNQGLHGLVDRYLTGLSCRMIGASGAQEGLRLAEEATPDAIMLDIMMPEMDGWELLQRLRANPHTTGIPVLICSVMDDPELAFSLGASFCMRKPFDREDLLDILGRLNLL